MKKTKIMGVAMLVVILLIGFIMRAPITTPPLFLGKLATALNVNQSSLGILTTLPLVMFMLLSNFAAKPMAYFGLKKALLMALGTIVTGSLLRLVMTMPTMILGTVLIGIGIAHLNVFMPSMVTAYFPHKIGLYTTMYSFAMIFGNTVFNLITAPVSRVFGWKMMMGILLLTPVIALLGWGMIYRFVDEKIRVDRSKQWQTTKTQSAKLWRNRRAWPFLLTFGGQATISYTFTAWMPSLMQYHHVSAGNSGLIMACFALIGLPLSIVLPNLLTTATNRVLIVLTIGAGMSGLTASCMLFWQNTSSMLFWMLESFLLGIAIGFFFMTAMTMFAVKTNSPYETARLSGMAQSGGYLMSAFGPSLYGMAFAANPVGNIQNVVYVVLVMLMLISCVLVIKTEKI